VNWLGWGEPRCCRFTRYVFVCALHRVLQVDDDRICSGLPCLFEAVWPVARHEEIAAGEHELHLPSLAILMLLMRQVPAWACLPVAGGESWGFPRVCRP